MKKLLSAILFFIVLSGPVVYAEELLSPPRAATPTCTAYVGTLPYVTCSGNWWTGLAIMNKFNGVGCLYIRYPGDAWKCHEINAAGVTLLVLDCPGPTYAELKSSLPLTIFEALSDGNIAFDYVLELEPCNEGD